jgi:hypothetical protein
VPYLKTDAAYRIVDLCAEAAELLRRFISNRSGLLFPSKKGTTPVSYSNLLKRHNPRLVILTCQLPDFRRYARNLIIHFPQRRFWITSVLPTTHTLSGQTTSKCCFLFEICRVKRDCSYLLTGTSRRSSSKKFSREITWLCGCRCNIA